MHRIIDEAENVMMDFIFATSDSDDVIFISGRFGVDFIGFVTSGQTEQGNER